MHCGSRPNECADVDHHDDYDHGSGHRGGSGCPDSARASGLGLLACRRPTCRNTCSAASASARTPSRRVRRDYGNWDIGIWASNPIGTNKVPGQSEPEVDPYGSYTCSINDSLSLQPGFTLYTYTKAPTNQGFYHATFEPNIALNYTVGALKLHAEDLRRRRPQGPDLRVQRRLYGSAEGPGHGARFHRHGGHVLPV